jgi:hypothetical protein
MNRPGIALAFVASLLVGGTAAAVPQLAQPAADQKVELVPHRAVYDLTLDTATAGSNVSDIRGRLVFDFTGSPCQGYSLNTRLVTAIIDRDGKAALTDIRSRSWEQADGGRFRFQTSQFLNNELSEDTKGDARRVRDSVEVSVQKPVRSKASLTSGVMFPTQHSLAILDSAARGERHLQASLFDGSEKGQKVYETTTFIGNPLPAGANRKLPEVSSSTSALDGLVSWPVVISYYSPAESREGLPVYETSFRMYANGVSRKIRFDYGNFAMTGELAQLEFKKPLPCTPARRGKAKNS